MKTRLLTAAAVSFGAALLLLALAAFEEYPHPAEQDLIRQSEAQLAASRRVTWTSPEYAPRVADALAIAHQAGELCFARRQRHTAEVWLAVHAGELAALLFIAGLLWPGTLNSPAWPSPPPSPARPTPTRPAH